MSAAPPHRPPPHRPPPHDRAPTPAGRRRGERLLGLLAAGIVAFNYPLLSIFSEVRLVAGVPAICLYLFAVWGALIGATALVLRRRRPGPPEP